METLYKLPKLDDLPLQFRLSFRPFVAYLKAQQQVFDTAHGLNELYNFLIAQFTEAISLTEASDKPIDEARLAELFQLATVAVLPLTQTSRDIAYAFGLPMPMTVFSGIRTCTPISIRIIRQGSSTGVTAPIIQSFLSIK